MAVTCNYYDSGTYHTFTMSGTGTITDAEIYTWFQQDEINDGVAAGTYMTRTGSAGSYEYKLCLQSGELYTRVYVSSGVTWQREEGATWWQEYSTGSGTYYSFYIQSGATLSLADDCVFDFGCRLGWTNARDRAYLLFYGTLTGQQTDGHNAIFKNYRTAYCYMYDTTPWDIENVTFDECSYTGGYPLYFNGQETGSHDGTQVAHTMKKLKFTSTHNAGYVYFRPSDFSKWILEDWEMDGIRIPLYVWFTFSAKFHGFNMQNSLDYCRNLGTSMANTEANIWTSKTKDWGANGNNQPLVVYEECIFDDLDSGVYSFIPQNGGMVLMKDCTFKNAQRGLYASDATVLLYGTQTYESITTADKTWSGQGTYLHVRKLDLTVNDSDGNPLENASVHIQTEYVKTVGTRDYPREQYSFITDENGQVKGVTEDSIYLTEKEETSNGVYTQWSDGTTGKSHRITVSHPDYATHTELIAMTEDKVRTITMSDEVGTVINESTLNETEIN